jgi:hypothetical protein
MLKVGHILSFFLLVCCFPFYTIAQLNRVDANGKKQGHWVYTGKDRPSSGYKQDVKVEEGDYKDNRKVGMWIKYYPDGKTPKLKGEYVNNRPEGSYVKYHSNGKIKEIGSVMLSINVDSLKRFHENGTLEYESVLNDQGKEQGSVKYFYSNGQLEFEYNVQEGIPVGEATRYYENGDVKEVLVYSSSGEIESSEQVAPKNPVVKEEPVVKPKDTAPKISTPNTRGVVFQPNGYNKVYNSNDDIWQDGTFKNGLLWDGKVYEYDKDGILLKVKVYKNGSYHSDGQL